MYSIYNFCIVFDIFSLVNFVKINEMLRLSLKGYVD